MRTRWIWVGAHSVRSRSRLSAACHGSVTVVRVLASLVSSCRLIGFSTNGGGTVLGRNAARLHGRDRTPGVYPGGAARTGCGYACRMSFSLNPEKIARDVIVVGAS